MSKDCNLIYEELNLLEKELSQLHIYEPTFDNYEEEEEEGDYSSTEANIE